MEYYLAVRMRRYGRAYPSGSGTGSDERGNERSMSSPNVGGRPMSAGGTSGGRTGVPQPSAGGTATAVSTVRPVTRGTGRETGPLLSISRARPGPPSTVRVSGTANAGVWGAGVRDSRRDPAAGAVDRDEPVGSGLEPVEQRSPRAAAGIRRHGPLGGPAARRAGHLPEPVVAQEDQAVELAE